MIVILIYIIYYCFSISPIIISHKFRRYRIANYNNNKILNKKRYYALAFNIFCLIIQAVIASFKEEIIAIDESFKTLLLSSLIFIFLYIFFSLGRLEIPKQTHKKKKKFK